MNLVLISLVGAGAGLLAGLFGVGGAVFVIPCLVYLFGMSQQGAQGTSIAMLLPPIGILAAWRYWKAGEVNVSVAITLALAFMIFAGIGAHFAIQLPQLLMKRLFGLFLVIMGLFMAITAK